MSSQRGIYQWLYDKIILLERIETDIVEWAENQGLAAKEWMKEIEREYGTPTQAKPLEKVTNNNNIPLWLSEKIESAESRHAVLISTILKEKPELKDGLANVFTKNAEASAREYTGVNPRTPEEIYIILNDYLLDGMPNERVNDILSGNENVIIWRTNKCLHRPYWDKAGGDIGIFYELRQAWVKAFIETLTPEFTYERRPNGDHKIVRK